MVAKLVTLAAALRRRALLAAVLCIGAGLSPLAIAQNAVNTATIAPPAGVTDPVGGCTAASPPVCSGNNTATDSDTIVAPQLTLAKTHTGDFTVGVNGTYTLTVSNTGTAPTSGTITVVDALPTGLTFVSGTGAGWTCTAAGQVVTCTSTTAIANGAAGVPIVLTVSVAAAASPSVTNTARASGGGDATCPASGATQTRCTPSDPTTVGSSADVSVTKTDGVATYVPGTSTVYTVVVANAGPSAATNVLVVDNAPAGTTITGWTCTGAACPAASGSGSISQTIVSLPSGGGVTYAITVVIPSGFVASVTNTATASSPTPDSVPGNNSASDTDTAVATSDVSIAKSLASPNPALPGQTVTWTIVASNNGPSDAVMTTSDTVPASVTGLTVGGANGGSCTVAGQLVSCAFGSVSNGVSRTYTISGTLSAGATGTLSNTASVATTSTDNTPGNNTSTSDTPIGTPAAVSVVKTGPATALVGSSYQYRLTLSNSGQAATATNLIVQDQLPAGVIATAATGANCGALPSAAGALLTCTVPGPIASGASVAVALTVTAPASGGNIVNYAATNPTGTGNPGTPPGPACVNDATTSCGSASTTVTAPQLTLLKTASASPFAAGIAASYTLQVTNTGDAPTTAAATVTDVIPSGLTIGVLPAGCVAASQTVTCTVATGLGVNASASFVVPVTAQESIAGTTVANTANVSGGGDATCPAAARCASTVSTPITATASFTLDKTATVADSNGNTVTGDAGDTITYTFSATNTGTVALAPVTVTDPLLPTLACTIATLAPGATASCAATGNTYVITAADVTAGSRANTATATGNAPGTIPDPTATDTATVTTVATPTASLTLAKTATVADTNGNTVTGDAGDTITYTFSATNTGTVTLAPVTVIDPLLSALACSIATLASGATASCAATGNTYLITTADATAGSRANTATATGDAPGSIPDPTATDTATVLTAAAPTASLTLAKTATVADTNGNTVTGDAGDTITYAFSVTNTGTVTLAPINVTDPLLPALACSIATLASGATASCAATGNTYLITTADVTAGSRANTATATGNAPGTIPDPTTTDTVSTPTAGSPTALLTLDKTATVADTNGNTVVGDAGDTVTYTFSATNTGTVTLAPVTVADPLLPALACSIATLAPGATASCAATGNTYVITAADVTAGSRANTATATGNAPGTIPDPTATDTATVTTVATPAASLTLAKTATVADTNGNTVTGDAGDTITYAFSATNTGTVTLAPVTVTDPLLPTLACTIATLAPGATASCAATGNTYVITAADVTAGSRANTATATGNAPGTIPDPTATDTATVTTAATPTASLTLDKTATVVDSNGNTVVGDAGDTITYAFSATNTGTVALAPVTVTDPLLPTLNCSIPNLAVGATASCAATGNNYLITAADVTAGLRANTATATGNAPGSIPDPTATDTATVTTAATPTASLTLDKTATVADSNGNTVVGDAGDTITYSFCATNTATVALAPVTVTDPLLPTLACTIATLAPGATASCAAAGNTYVITAADVTAGSRANTATATGDAPGSIPDPIATDTATVLTAAAPTASLTLAKTATVADTNGNTVTGDAGDTITYAFSVTNTGTVTLAPISVTDPLLPALNCSIPNLAVGATASCAATGNTYVITMADVTAGSRANTATATGNAPGSIPDPTTTDTVNTPTSAATPGLSLVKSAGAPVDANGNGVTDAGDTIAYMFAVTNTGNTPLNAVVVNDAKLSPAPIACAPATVAVGGTATCGPAIYTITAADVAAGTVANSATATGTPPGGAPVTSAPSMTNTPTTAPAPSLSSLKTLSGTVDADNSGGISAGDTLTYTVTVTNTGNVPLNNVVITDARITPSSATCASVIPNGTCVLTGEYVVSQADVDAGTIVNTAGFVTQAPPGGPPLPPQACPTGSADPRCAPTVSTPVVQRPAIATAKTATLTTDDGTPGAGNAGDVITYAVTVANTGNVTLFNLVVTDSFEAGAPTTLSCTPTTLVPGTSATCASYTHTITQAEVDAGGALDNSATATAQASGGAQTVSGTSSASVTVDAAPTTVRITKTATPHDVKIGDLVRYTLIIENTGAANVVDASIVDTPPAGFTFVGNSLTVADDNGAGRLVGTYPVRIDQIDVAAGARATVTYLLRIGAGVRPGIHTNSAYVQDNGATVSNVATADVQMVADPLLDESLIVGTVFDDRDGDGWQDSAAMTDVRVQGGFAAAAYVAGSTAVDRGNGPAPEADASAPLLHGIALGNLAARRSDADLASMHAIVISQTLSALDFNDDFALTTKQGVTVRMDAAGNTRVERNGGDAAKGLTAATPTVQRRVSRVENGYRVDYIIGNDGVDERGIPGVRIASVEGLLIETDQFGRYHLVGVEGGPWERGRNFILKVDPATLPPGSAFTTANPLLRRVTPGLPTRFDFGVKLPPGLVQGGRQTVELELGSVMFDAESAKLRERYLPVIDKMVEQVRQHDGGEVVIAANGGEALAYERAKSVQAALLERLSPEQTQTLKISLRTDLAEASLPEASSTLLTLDAHGNAASPVLGAVLFDTDRSEIKPQYAPVIAAIAADIERIGGGVIGVVGHADKRGSDAYNVALGLRRAKAVYEAIAAQLDAQARAKLRVEISEDPTAPVAGERGP